MELSAPKFREVVFQLLFSLDLNGQEEAELIPLLMKELALSKKHVSAAYKKALDVWRTCATFDALIAKQAKNYSFERIKRVERNALRLALYEWLIEKEPNTKITISEAHRLTRKFGTVEGASFVNALLEEVIHDTSIPTPTGAAAQ